MAVKTMEKLTLYKRALGTERAEVLSFYTMCHKVDVILFSRRYPYSDLVHAETRGK